MCAPILSYFLAASRKAIWYNPGMENRKMTRRQFVKNAATTGIAAALNAAPTVSEVVGK